MSSIWLGTGITVAIPLAFIVTALLGLLIERVVVRRLYGRLLDTLLATWGIAILIQQAVRLEFGLTFLGIHIEGLGPGLVPSGDSVVSGVLLALRLLGGAISGGTRAVWLANWLSASVTCDAAQRTTTLGASLLHWTITPSQQSS